MAALEPYRFEPERVRDVADDESSEDNELDEQLESKFWCSCRKCVVMLTPRECICCVEHPESENFVRCRISGRSRAQNDFRTCRFQKVGTFHKFTESCFEACSARGIFSSSYFR